MKMQDQKYVDYIMEKTVEVLAVDSPTGYTKEAAEYVCNAYRALGYEPVLTVKGGVLVDLTPQLEAKAEVMLDKLEDKADELKDKAENFFDKIENAIEDKLKK